VTPPPWRVLLVNANFADGTCGGTQVWTELLAQWLSARGHDVAVLCTGEETRRETHPAAVVYRVRPPRVTVAESSRPTRFANQSLAMHNPLVAGDVRRALRDFRPDVCHLQMLRRLTPAAYAALGRRPPFPVLWTIHELYSLWNFDPFAPDDNPRKLATRRPRFLAPVKYRHRRLSRRLDRVTAPSHYALDAWRGDGYFRGVPATVLPLAVPHEWGPPEALATERAVRGGAEAMSFLFLGRLDHVKGVVELLRAWERLDDPGCLLHFAGAGMLEPYVRRAAARDHRIRFHGLLAGRSKRDLLRCVDAIVFPSTWGETFGLSLLEGFAAALPCIATRVGAVPDVVNDGETGLLVPPGDDAALRAAVTALRDPARRARMSAAAARAALRHDPDRFVDALEALYAEALSRRRATTVASLRLW
jgi:glycosyltransferase involved in cell wall biosynthesis